MGGHWLDLYDGWAVFAIFCTIYFIGEMLVKVYKWIDEPFKVKDEIEKELEELKKGGEHADIQQ